MAIKPFRMKDDYGELSYHEENKNAFLKDAAKLMRVIGRSLLAEPYGFPYTSVTINKAGVAVSGEVYLYIVLPGLIHGLMVQISQASFYPQLRNDNLKVLLQYRKFREPVVVKAKTKLPSQSIHGSNQWFEDSMLDSDDLLCWIDGHIMRHPCVNDKKQNPVNAQQIEDAVLARGKLGADTLEPDNLPTVGEVIDAGGELGKTLERIKNTMAEMSAVMKNSLSEPCQMSEMVENEVAEGKKIGDACVKPEPALATGAHKKGQENTQPLVADKKRTPEPALDVAPPSNDDVDSLMCLFSL